jgi:hypothetical protein
MNITDYMKQINDAAMTAGGVYLEEGEFKLRVREAKNGHAESQGWDFFVVEFEIIESSNPKLRVGQIVEWMVAFKNPQYIKTYLGNVKNFLYSVFAAYFDDVDSPEDINEAVWALAVSEAQPLQGKTVAARAFNKNKKNTPGEQFTRVVFSQWREDEQAAA